MVPGFVRLPAGEGSLWVAEDLRDAVLAAGLANPATWPRGAPRGAPTEGRGALTRVALADGTRLLLKQLRRGGAFAPFWADRFVGRARLEANLEVPTIARERGVATPRAIALLEIPGPAGFFRGWLAVEEIVGSRNLLELLRREPRDDDVAAAVAAIRAMHDAGIRHRDLNLANVIVLGEPPAPRGFVVDLDGARAQRAPLGEKARRAGLRRLERSYRKAFLANGPLGNHPGERLVALYASDDERLRRALERGRAWTRISLALRAYAWRRRRPL